MKRGQFTTFDLHRNIDIRFQGIGIVGELKLSLATLKKFILLFQEEDETGS